MVINDSNNSSERVAKEFYKVTWVGSGEGRDDRISAEPYTRTDNSKKLPRLKCLES